MYHDAVDDLEDESNDVENDDDGNHENDDDDVYEVDDHDQLFSMSSIDKSFIPSSLLSCRHHTNVSLWGMQDRGVPGSSTIQKKATPSPSPADNGRMIGPCLHKPCSHENL